MENELLRLASSFLRDPCDERARALALAFSRNWSTSSWLRLREMGIWMMGAHPAGWECTWDKGITLWAVTYPSPQKGMCE